MHSYDDAYMNRVILAGLCKFYFPDMVGVCVYPLLFAGPMSCMPEAWWSNKTHNVGFLTIPRASIKWVKLWELLAYILNMHSYSNVYVNRAGLACLVRRLAGHFWTLMPQRAQDNTSQTTLHVRNCFCRQNHAITKHGIIRLVIVLLARPIPAC